LEARGCSLLSARCSLLSALYSLLPGGAWHAWELILLSKSLT
jgi:hypothetical protein